MTADFSSIRTLQDVINVLSVLYSNMNTIERNYYDIFLNNIPKTLSLQVYNENGELTTIQVPNRASYLQMAVTGSGDPNATGENKEAGTIYLDTATEDLWYRAKPLGEIDGWYKIFSNVNWVAGVDYLKPDGSAAHLTDINITSASGVLNISNGGTGTSTAIEGVLKGNGSSPFSAAVPNKDYLAPEALIGCIAYYPLFNTESLPDGWLPCNGGAYSRTTYAKLFEKIGVTYGSGDGSNTFNVPNLTDYFVRCWDGTSNPNVAQTDQVGSHTHSFSGSTGTESATHVHAAGTMRIDGIIQNQLVSPGVFTSSGCITAYDMGSSMGTMTGGDFDTCDITIQADSTHGWSGSTATESATHTHTFSGTTGSTGGTETRVKNKMLLPIIYYGN